ncbi:MAG: hypothetical protein ABIP77_09635 [Candidatus Limnocylindrales bacterium]
MNLINLDGLALIGPGSEWFWSMLQFVIVAITLYAIYRQLRLQASAGAIEQMAALERDWNSEPLIRSRLAILLALRDGVDPADVPDRAASEIGNFWERVGYLVLMGHIERRLLYEYLGPAVRLWWTWLTPTTHRERKRTEQPRNNEHFEWLVGVMAEMDRKAGMGPAFDVAYLDRLVPRLIESSLDAIRLAEDLRSVIVRPMSTATLNSSGKGRVSDRG